jgi:hypothetical protein
MKIISKHAPKEVRQLVAVIYGMPGIGKTSLAMSADTPLLVDTDNGSHRAIGQTDVLSMDSWQDFVELIESPVLDNYNTLVVDTLDTLLGYVVQDIKDKMIVPIKGSNKQPLPIDPLTGVLTLTGYGLLAKKFGDAVDQLRRRRVDMIFIAHAKESKEDGPGYMVPDILGQGSYKQIRRMADMIGYAEMTPQGRTVHFAPSARHEGKDPFGLLGSVVIEPSPKDARGRHIPTGQMARLMAMVREGLSQATAVSDELAAEMAELRADIEAATSVTEMTALVNTLMGYDGGPIPAVLKPVVAARAKALGYTWDKEAACYKEGGSHAG